MEEKLERGGSKGKTESTAVTRRNERVSKEAIQELWEKYHGNKTKIASELNISRTTLWKYLKEYR